MSEWISVEDRLPDNASNGVHDMRPYLVITNEPYGDVSEFNIRICHWVNNRFSSFPAGATRVTHWMPLPAPPTTEDGDKK